MRNKALLQAGDQLQQDAIHSVRQAQIDPGAVGAMLLALEQEQSLEMVVCDRIRWQVQMAIPERLEDRQTLFTLNVLLSSGFVSKEQRTS